MRASSAHLHGGNQRIDVGLLGSLVLRGRLFPVLGSLSSAAPVKAGSQRSETNDANHTRSHTEQPSPAQPAQTQAAASRSDNTTPRLATTNLVQVHFEHFPHGVHALSSHATQGRQQQHVRRGGVRVTKREKRTP